MIKVRRCNENDIMQASSTITIAENLMAEQPRIDYSIQANGTNICISCTFLDSTLTDCVAVVHRRISQLSSSGLMKIESSHNFNRSSGDTAYGCIEGVDLERYQVGVFGVKIINGNYYYAVMIRNCHATLIIVITSRS